MAVHREQFGLLNVRDLARGTSSIIDEVEREHACFVITRHGTPVATLTPIDPEALEDFILAQAPEFVRSRRSAERELAQGKTVSLSKFLEGEPEDME
ncbi:MAG: Antitoxin Phd YefM, type toxin-antitoxin system [Actinomycetota bacterium]|jgi:prevent-host-death family protein|nr:Antitoxin Phd YefM, type toxin-antitoxin system [Actinomycetota bacterium]MEA2566259.1 Antitoxin Phd YefM, type toxin-antitoxin system [Actinomycetota bacterium]MEA2589897.1 Antitoxin Phd YefM, type toxin-antitoxin system [Actinomycetota bacterium]